MSWRNSEWFRFVQLGTRYFFLQPLLKANQGKRIFVNVTPVLCSFLASPYLPTLPCLNPQRVYKRPNWLETPCSNRIDSNPLEWHWQLFKIWTHITLSNSSLPMSLCIYFILLRVPPKHMLHFLTTLYLLLQLSLLVLEWRVSVYWVFIVDEAPC